MLRIRTLTLSLSLVLFAVPLAPAGAADNGLYDAVRSRFESEARAHGIDPALLMTGPAEVTVATAKGTEIRVEPFGEALARILPSGPVVADSGPGGAEVVAGNLTHIFADFRQGSGGGYTVANSSLVPATPPVILPPPATIYGYSVGGPFRSIKGNYNILGLHMVGTIIGSNISTAPGPYVVWPPVLSGGFIADSSIDFAGHAVYVQARFCLFGFCVSAGAILLADGAALFNNTTPVSLPVLP